jgi:hypothetical protein
VALGTYWYHKIARQMNPNLRTRTTEVSIPGRTEISAKHTKSAYMYFVPRQDHRTRGTVPRYQAIWTVDAQAPNNCWQRYLDHQKCARRCVGRGKTSESACLERPVHLQLFCRLCTVERCCTVARGGTLTACCVEEPSQRAVWRNPHSVLCGGTLTACCAVARGRTLTA